MDPILKAYSDQGILALSFGILLIGALWIIKYLLVTAKEERKEAKEEAQKERDANRLVLERVVTAMDGIKTAMLDMERKRQ